MRTRMLGEWAKLGMAVSILTLSPVARAHELSDSEQTATGQHITPTALRGAFQQDLNPGLSGYPDFVAGEAVRSALSPDGSTLAVLCAGQNSLYDSTGVLDSANSTQYIFLYDVSGAHKQAPQLTQVLKQTNAHVGLAFSPDGTKLYAAGGRDDAVYIYARSGSWAPSGKIALGHSNVGVGIGVAPNASGLGLSADGKTLVVANNYNDSVSVIDTGTATVRYEHDLRPFFANNEGTSGAAGGTFPFAVVVKGNGIAYVSSDRDREVVVLDISSPTAGRLVKRIKLDGNGLGLALDASGERLFVAEDNADQVAVIDTTRNAVVARIDARAPLGMLTSREGGRHDDADGQSRRPHYTGAATFAVTLAPEGKTLYAVNAGANSIAVIPLRGEHAYQVEGLIPTAYEPHDVTFSSDGSYLYIVNGKSLTGPNPKHLASNTAAMTTFPGGAVAAAAAAAGARASNQYQFQLERASLVSAPVPSPKELERLTMQVAANNFYGAERGDDYEVMEFLRHHIKHVIYINKENRTFDQILGDLNNGSNGDGSLTQFPEVITPNFHKIARQFVTLDNFRDPGDGSMDGWSWSLQGRVTNTETLTQQINYAFVNRGLSYESEGSNRNVPVNWGSVGERDAAAGPAGTTNYSNATASIPGGPANVLAGTGNHASSDAPFGAQKGYIFDAVLQAGGTVRNYGFLVNNIGFICTDPLYPSKNLNCSASESVSDPFAAGVIQVGPLDTSLAPVTDLYFRGYDQNYPDLWRYNEWKREFDGYVAGGDLPSLSLVRFSHDHMGSFSTALAGVNTPELQQADDDLAVGLLVQAVSKSRYAGDTLIFVNEDDCQDGPDHVDSHRATAYVVGPYVKQGAVVSVRYSQVNVLRTIEDILGAPHLNLNTAFQRPMADVFHVGGSGHWSFVAEKSTYLGYTQLPQAPGAADVRFAKGPNVKPKHDASYWARVTAGFDFSDADLVPPEKFNRVLWAGLMEGKPYPAAASPRVSRASDD
ncbi:MAG TPA: bifunctional YncE family protein/alkaline phosphatase family protein [Anaeromyxobacter sp.]|nr:bifunctional YncE family protein/alkaline phosphatase family protein [Anaeromyxobacter sp.]